MKYLLYLRDLVFDILDCLFRLLINIGLLKSDDVDDDWWDYMMYSNVDQDRF